MLVSQAKSPRPAGPSGGGFGNPLLWGLGECGHPGTRSTVPWCLEHPSAEGCESSSGTLLSFVPCIPYKVTYGNKIR